MSVYSTKRLDSTPETITQNTTNKFLSHYGILIFLFVLRLLNVVFVQTWFVPDEYWQSLEVAHNLVFSYGYLTWEWSEAIRSYFHPFLFGVFYYFVKIVGLSDFTEVLIYGPRLIQATLSAIGEWCFFKFVRKQFGANIALWFLFSLSTSWFWWYCATRTLINSIEAVLVCVSFYFYPWNESYYGKKFNIFLIICILTVCIRPTSVVLWIPMCFSYMLRFSYRHSMLTTLNVLFKSTFVVFFVLFFSLLVDSYFYGKWVNIYYNFLLFNVIKNQGTFYGSHPWHWYLFQGIPVVAGTHLPFVIHGAVHCCINKKLSNHQRKLFFFICSLIVVTVFLYSIPGHKEFRFLLLILPLMMLFCGFSLSFMSKIQQKCAVIFIFSTNFVAMSYTGIYHQSAPLDILNHIRHYYDSNKLNSSETQILFLLPCHSTPYYSHLHRNVSMRFLTCEPDLTYQKQNYIDEADQFFTDPLSWVMLDLFSLNETRVVTDCPSHLPSFIVLYDQLETQIGHALSPCFTLSHRSFHTHFPSGRVGSHMLVLLRK